MKLKIEAREIAAMRYNYASKFSGASHITIILTGLTELVHSIRDVDSPEVELVFPNGEKILLDIIGADIDHASYIDGIKDGTPMTHLDLELRNQWHWDHAWIDNVKKLWKERNNQWNTVEEK